MKRARKFFLFSIFFISQFAAADPEIISRNLAQKMTESMHHGSGILSWGKGKLLSCWFTGTRESGRDVQIYCTDSEDNGETWTQPRVVVKRQEKAQDSRWENKTVGNCSLFRDTEGNIWLFYAAVVWGGWSGSHVDYKISKDDGKSWSESRRLVGTFGNLPRNKALMLSDGKVLLPLYNELIPQAEHGYLYEMSLKDGQVISEKALAVPGAGHLQPTVVEFSPDVFYVYLRNKKPGRTHFAIYDRKKNKWTPPELIDVPNPDAALDSIGYRGGVLLVYNDSPKRRNPLALGFAKDGRTFVNITNLENDPTAGGFSYPSITQDDAGYFHLTYTYDRKYIKYVRFNRQWLDERLP